MAHSALAEVSSPHHRSHVIVSQRKITGGKSQERPCGEWRTGEVRQEGSTVEQTEDRDCSKCWESRNMEWVVMVVAVTFVTVTSLKVRNTRKHVS